MKTFVFGALGALLLGGVIGCGETSTPPAEPAASEEAAPADDAAKDDTMKDDAAPAEGSGDAAE